MLLARIVFIREIAKPAEPVNSQDERRIRAAVDSPARYCRQAIKTTGRAGGFLYTIIADKILFFQNLVRFSDN